MKLMLFVILLLISLLNSFEFDYSKSNEDLFNDVGMLNGKDFSPEE